MCRFLRFKPMLTALLAMKLNLDIFELDKVEYVKLVSLIQRTARPPWPRMQREGHVQCEPE